MIDATATILRLKNAATWAGDNPRVAVLGTLLKDATLDDSPGNMDVEGVVTTARVDMDQEIIRPDGLDWSYFDRRKTVYVDHEYEMESAIGSMRWVKPELLNGKIIGHRMRMALFTSPNSKAAMLVRDWLKQFGTIGFSIGMAVDETDRPSDEEKAANRNVSNAITKARVIEVSATLMPANIDCEGRLVSPGQTNEVIQRMARVRLSMLPKRIARVRLTRAKS